MEDFSKNNYGSKGQELANLIASMDPELVRRVQAAAKAGNTQQALADLAPLLNDPKIRQLAKEVQNGK